MALIGVGTQVAGGVEVDPSNVGPIVTTFYTGRCFRISGV